MYKKILLTASALILNNIQSSGFKFAVSAGPVARFASYKISSFDTSHSGDSLVVGKKIALSKNKESDFTLKSKLGYFAGRASVHVGSFSVGSVDVFGRVFGDLGSHKSYLNDKHDLVSSTVVNAAVINTPGAGASGASGAGAGAGASGDTQVNGTDCVPLVNASNKPDNVGSDSCSSSSILERKNTWRIGFGPEASFCISESMKVSISAGPLFSNLKQTFTTSVSSYTSSGVQYGGFVSVIGRMFFGEESKVFAYGELMGTYLSSKDLKAEGTVLVKADPAVKNDITFKHAKSLGGNVSIGVGYSHHG